MYDKYINIDKKFKSSVNLQYDIGNEEKILRYVPTTDLCDVIKCYLKSVLNGDSIKSYILAGPYGKGKSYLMLIIIYLLSKRDNKELLGSLIYKISHVDKELAEIIRKLDRDNISLLPVIINNNDSDDLTQNFMLALRNSLQGAGLEKIVPNSTFTECLNEISAWENNKDLNLLEICKERCKISITSLKTGLKSYSKNSYNKFLSLFECINHGYKFNALVGNDISTTYLSVAQSIKKMGYRGLFVIFDEFGAFLENKSQDFSLQLNKIQAFAERCNSSSIDAQLHFCCITHKDITLYKDYKSFLGEFEKISGRFKQIRFDRSLDENYQIICNALEKLEGYDEISKDFYRNEIYLYEKIKKSGILSSTKQLKFIMDYGFPFNPIALYVLIQISEKIAQNERTLFTFLSDSDLYSFRYFIANNGSGLLNVDYVYNYFQNLIKTNNEYKSLFFKVDSLSRIDLKKEHHDIFKCIALMKVINDEIMYSSTVFNIALSLGKDEKVISDIVDELISFNILKRSVTDNSIDFNLLADNEINKLLDTIVITKKLYESKSELLSKFDNDRYVVSNKYNFEFSMTRYFYTIYLESSEIKKLNSFDVLLNESKADGIIINLINNDNSNIEDIIEVLNHLSDSSNRVIIRMNNNKIEENVFYKIKRIFASKYLLETNITMNDAVIESLKLSVEDMTVEIREFLKEYFQNSFCLNITDFKERSLKNTTYNSLKNSFPQTIIFNNEQVNKDVLSAATTKSRNNVIDNILNNSDIVYGPTSAEGTIGSSFDKTIMENQNIIVHLQKLIIDSNKKISANVLVDYLLGYPFGIRKGVIPLLIAKTISMLNVFEKNNVQTVLLYNDSMQIKLDSSNLTKLISNPNRYYFSFKKINKERIHFIESLAYNFKINITRSFNEDADNVIKGLRSFVSNLEPVIVKSTLKDNILDLSKDEINFKDLFMRRDLSTFEILCEELNEFGANSAEILGNIILIKEEYRNKVSNLYEESIKKVKSIFSQLNQESIKTNYSNWKNKNNQIDSYILDNENKKIFNTFETLQYNDYETIDKLSYSILNCTLNDWNLQKKELFFSRLNAFVEFVGNYNKTDNFEKSDFDCDLEMTQITKLGITLYTNLQEVLDEYGASLSNSEKANVLKMLMKQIID